MNQVDKNIVVGTAIIATVGYLYMSKQEKSLKPVKILGLDSSNSKKLTGAIALITIGILSYNLIKGKKIAV